MEQNARYEATHFPGMLTEFAAYADGKTKTLLTREWTVCDCRRYAINGGFSAETVKRIDGLAVFVWNRPTSN